MDILCRIGALVAMVVSGFMLIALVSYWWSHRRRPADPRVECTDDRHVDMTNSVCVRRIVERECRWRDG